ncbi:MAG: Ig domain-containing protein [Pseudomonadota bacterium]
MASIDKIKGRYLFGGSQAASIVPQAGSGSLIPTAGAGGFTYHSNYVDCKTGSYFTTPFNTVPRDRTIIVAGNFPVYERVYDDDTVYRFPPTIAHAAAMSGANSIWTDTTGAYSYLSETLTGLPNFGPGNGDGSASVDTYDRPAPVIAYQDGAFTFMPGIMIATHPATGPVALGFQSGRNLAWVNGNVASYPDAALAGAPKSRFGHVEAGGGAGAQATAHCFLLGYAEYSALTREESLEAATEMVVLLEARGWTGLFHNPVTSEVPPVVVSLSPVTALGLVVGTPFTRTFTGSGGTVPYTFALDGGTLPAGLTLVSGVLSGTPTTAGAYSFGIKATDANAIASATTTFSGSVSAGASSQPAIVAANANFTVADSPTSGFKRITKTGGTDGTLERAAFTATALVDGWTIECKDPLLAMMRVGVSKAAGPNGPDALTGWNRGAADSIYPGYWVDGGYGGNYVDEAGQTFSVSRESAGGGGYVGIYTGTDHTAAALVQSYTMGQTDAAVPVVFDCALGIIGEYIDVKIA